MAFESFDEYLDSIAETPLLEADKELALQQKVHAGTEPEAEQLYQHNLKLVAHIAKKFFQYSDMPPMELVEVGNTALRYAISMYASAAPDVAPSTYYTWWVRKSLSQAVVKYIFSELYELGLSARQDKAYDGYFSSFFVLQLIGSLMMFDVDENTRQSLGFALSGTFSDSSLNEKISHRNFIFRSPYLRDLLTEQNPGVMKELEQYAAQSE